MLVTPSLDEIASEIVPGRYKGIVKKAELKEWSEGKPYINWEIETVGSTEPKDNGRRIYHKTSTTGKGAFMLQKFYRAVTGQALSGPFDTETLIGKQIEFEVVDGVNRQTGEKTGYIEVKNVFAVQG